MEALDFAPPALGLLGSPASRFLETGVGSLWRSRVSITESNRAPGARSLHEHGG